MTAPSMGAALRLIDRYIFKQYLRLFGFYALVLISLYWVNRAVILFDRLIGDGQSAAVFLEITLLSLPAIILIVLPFAAFVAAVSVTNRMSNESELIILRAAGISPLRMSVPVSLFGLVVMVFMLLLTNIIAPMSIARLTLRETEIARDQTARLLTPGSFNDFGSGLTLFFESRGPEGRLQKVIIRDATIEGEETIYFAEDARIESTETQTWLALYDGSSQILNYTNGRMTHLDFDRLSYDVSSYFYTSKSANRAKSAVPTPELLRADPALVEEMNMPANRLRAIGHNRFSQPLLGLIAAMIGYAPLMLAYHSRSGLWPQIFFGVASVVFLMAIDGFGQSVSQDGDGYWPAVYLGSLTGAVLCMIYLAYAQFQPRRRFL